MRPVWCRAGCSSRQARAAWPDAVSRVRGFVLATSFTDSTTPPRLQTQTFWSTPAAWQRSATCSHTRSVGVEGPLYIAEGLGGGLFDALLLRAAPGRTKMARACELGEALLSLSPSRPPPPPSLPQEPMPVDQLVRQLCDTKQGYTQFGGLRPFGVSLLYGGW